MKILDWLIGGNNAAEDMARQQQMLADCERRSIDAHMLLMTELRRLDEQLRAFKVADDDQDGRPH